MVDRPNPIRDAARRELGARLARAALVLGIAGWLGVLLAQVVFGQDDNLFYVGLVCACLFSAGIILRAAQLIWSRRFPLLLKTVFTIFVLVFAYGVIFALVLISILPFDETPFEETLEETRA